MKKATVIISAVILFTLAVFSARATGTDLTLRSDGCYYNSAGRKIEGIVCRGIDISSWQYDIDWELVSEEYKKGTIDFVIIRCGYGDDLASQDDKKFTRNADGCTQYGIPFGVYLYSYATNTTMAKSEASHVLRLVKNYTLTYPVFYDFEDKTQSSLSAAECASMVDAFCSALQAQGYETGVYSYRNRYAGEMFSLIDFDGKNYVKWVAEYNDVLHYNEGFDIWQSNSSGSLNGISTDLDINYSFMEKRELSHCYVTFDLNGSGASCETSFMHADKGRPYGWLPTPARDGYVFSGWYTAKSGGKQVTASSKAAASGKQTLYARWKKGTPSPVTPSGDVPASPAGSLFSVIPPMASGAPYMINGLNASMEYSLDGGEWIGGEYGRIRQVSAGQTIRVRFRQNGRTPASAETVLYIHGTLAPVPAVSPTCVSEGNAAYYRDSKGNCYISRTSYVVTERASFTIPPTGIHTYAHKCSEDCTVCGFHRETKHSFPADWTGRDGDHFKKCRVCGKEIYGEHILPEEWSPDADGHFKSCEICGYRVTEAHEAPLQWLSDADAHSRECAVCGFIETGAHIWNETPRYDGDCHWRDCAVCGRREAAQHSMTEAGRALPTCEEYGYVISSCALCGYAEWEIYPSLGHDFDENGVCARCGFGPGSEDIGSSESLPAEPPGTGEEPGAGDQPDLSSIPETVVSALPYAIAALAVMLALSLLALKGKRKK